MTTAEAIRETIRAQADHPDCDHIGPYAKVPENYDHIEALLWAAGLAVNAEGYAMDIEEA